MIIAKSSKVCWTQNSVPEMYLVYCNDNISVAVRFVRIPMQGTTIDSKCGRVAETVRDSTEHIDHTPVRRDQIPDLSRQGITCMKPRQGDKA